MIAEFPTFITKNIPLSEHTYYRIGGVARYFAKVTSWIEVQESILWARQNKLPIAVLGAGSNSVYADGVFQGLIISLALLSRWNWESDRILFVEAGVSNSDIAEIVLKAKRKGAAWMFKLPGQIGASVRMNARCYGGEISEIVLNIITIDNTGTLKTYQANEVFIGYKNTIFMHKAEIILGLRLSFTDSEDPELLLNQMCNYEKDRLLKHQFDAPSCGSTFKNNYNIGKPSGQIFESLNLKGKRIGDAEVSQHHANFIWNKGHATAHDMLQLAAYMREQAQTKLGFELDLEVQPIGLFSDDLYQRCNFKKLSTCYFNEETGQWWSGLFYVPIEAQKENIIYPRKVFSSPFFNYKLESKQKLPSIYAELFQLMPISEAKKNPDLPFLEWKTSFQSSPKSIFPYWPELKKEYSDNKQKTSIKDLFMDELWHYSVSELFIAYNKSPPYFEFEISPSGHWLALSFQEIRKRSLESDPPNPELWINKLKINPLAATTYETKEIIYSLGMSFNYKLFNNNQQSFLQEANEDFKLSIQCALSLGAKNQYFLSPPWNTDPKETANFHRPQRFWQILLF